MITPYPINNNNTKKRKEAKELKRKGSREMGRIKERNKRRRKTQHIFSNASISTYEKVYNSCRFTTKKKKNNHQNVLSSFLFSSFLFFSFFFYSFSYSPSSALVPFLSFLLLKTFTNTVALVIGPKCSATLSLKHIQIIRSRNLSIS